ncbi:MAG TPA: NAD(+) synthase, partial [Candidatus Dormibacteraeota bacterium]|nr:NAD(+) synthase [Candidatus Dormibacteraeota bacterium]
MERRSLRLALAQINPTVGDLPGNTRLILDWIDQAKAARADLIVFPELALTGYPPEDLVLKPSFIDQNLQYLEQVVAASRGIAVITGFVDRREDVYNAAAIAHGGELRGVYHKIHLPNYGVFDEERYFRPGRRCPIVELRGIKLGITICEDAWYGDGPMLVQARHGVEILININGSPYHRSKRETRERMIATRASDSRAYLAWVNLAGGQDELVFDGNSAMFDPEGRIIQRAPSFEESLLVVDVDPSAVLAERLHDPRLRKVTAGPLERGLAITQITLKSSSPPPPPASVFAAAKPLTGAEEVYAALLVGTRDYIHKSGFQKVVVGLSGGIDSALTAAVAADALGPNNVIGVAMPSRYTSKASEHDAAELAAALGLELIVIPIDPARRSYEEMLAGPFAGTESGLAEENIQPRIRGNLLMALCNKFGYLLLTTGNK